MKTLALTLVTCGLLAGCTTTTTEYIAIEKECPSCNPPVRQFHVVTECTDYQDTSLSANTYAQCRYCTNKIYSNGVDVTAQFMGQKKSTKPKAKKYPCKK